MMKDYEENDQVYSNVCYVGGEGEGSSKTYVTVGDDEAEGLALREVYVDGSSVTSEGLTIAQYKAALAQYGQAYLDSDAQKALSFTATVQPNDNFIYGTHYDLGDIVTIKRDDWGISEDLRLIEITEVYEHGLPVIEPIFGTKLPETIDWED